MHSENDIKYKDIISGKVATDYSKLPRIRPGYDSFFTSIPKPAKIIDTKSKGMARYLSVLPITSTPLTLGEGATPLTPSKIFDNVYIKNEGFNPTGNFKDRESAIALAYAKEKGIKNLAIASSGNAALSSALYAKIYGLNITCYVPSRTSRDKTDMIDLFGGATKTVGDTYEEAYQYLLENASEHTLNITSGAFPLRSDGVKTIAYEIWEDLGKVPDVVVCPAGNGSALASIYHGFSELKEWGLIDKLPAMVSVQIADADPINQALLKDSWFEILDDPISSRAEAIVAQESYCSPKAIYALKESGGFGISLSDKQVIKGLRFAIDKEGVFPEYSSASVFAAMSEYEEQIKAKGSTVVLINTATGLKELQTLSEVLKNSH